MSTEEKDQLVTICRYNTPIDAHMAKNKLESEGIMVFLFDENIVSINPLFSNLMGGIKLKTLASDADKAVSILNYVTDQPYIGEQETAVQCPRCGSFKLTYVYESGNKLKSFFGFAIAFLTFTLPLLSKDQYQCNNCGKKFRRA
ncbi:DUF2007 domain-containing protein [Rufibacter sp. LB8]|uniref:putative signal transducing protein n=1 Tax=Rufibacter sp. LB8 TaxID=2777781 RepID=UPI00178C3E4C|nr:DUF2007 domain-containing protein [Rufibacter sp. LB8]